MTRPDPRLLVPVSCVPFVPEGARVWVPTHDEPYTAICDDSITDGPSGGFLGCSPTDLLDLSAPAKRDGLDERLDVLPWALRVLGFDPQSTLVQNNYGNGLIEYAARCNGRIGGYIARNRIGSPRSPVIALGDAWPSLDSLTPDEQARAVVCAALRARGGSNG